MRPDASILRSRNTSLLARINAGAPRRRQKPSSSGCAGNPVSETTACASGDAEAAASKAAGLSHRRRCAAPAAPLPSAARARTDTRHASEAACIRPSSIAPSALSRSPSGLTSTVTAPPGNCAARYRPRTMPPVRCNATMTWGRAGSGGEEPSPGDPAAPWPASHHIRADPPAATAAVPSNGR
ncbi:MAG: hypothetical protein BWZ02_03387 [Lentisphaerae bacterium ADurb.BinA184]|nr:MAG: hypothetical protein BWZ02_03387 [Lentisphaerae bacterium ADurb.BinA184]